MTLDPRQYKVETAMRKVATAQYTRLEGVVVGERYITLWDWAMCRYRPAKCVVVSLGSRPPVAPWGRRESFLDAPKQKPIFRDADAAQTAYEYLVEYGVAPVPIIAEATGLDKDKLEALVKKRRDLFTVALKVGRQPYYKAVM